METLEGCLVGVDGPVTKLVTVTPDEVYNPPLRWIRVENEGGGTVNLVAANDEDDAAQSMTLAQGGELTRVAIRKVLAAGTTATTIIGGR